MPREVKAYACAFRCGGRVSTRLKSVEAHERTCASNPARRACRTCLHQRGGLDPWECELDLVPAGAMMAWDCTSWKPNEALATKEGA